MTSAEADNLIATLPKPRGFMTKKTPAQPDADQEVGKVAHCAALGER